MEIKELKEAIERWSPEFNIKSVSLESDEVSYLCVILKGTHINCLFGLIEMLDQNGFVAHAVPESPEFTIKIAKI